MKDSADGIKPDDPCRGVDAGGGGVADARGRFDVDPRAAAEQVAVVAAGVRVIPDDLGWPWDRRE